MPLLVRHFLEREGFADTEASPEVMEVFYHYAWPGNVRELRNVLVRAAMLCVNRRVTREDLPPELLTFAIKGNGRGDDLLTPLYEKHQGGNLFIIVEQHHFLVRDLEAALLRT